MRARHDIACLGVATGDFGDDVIAVAVAVVEADIVVELDHRLAAGLCQPDKTAIVLRRKFDGGQSERAPLTEIIASAVHQLAVTVRHPHPADCPFGFQEGIELFDEFDPLQPRVEFLGIIFGLIERIELAQFLRRVAAEGGLVGLGPCAR